MDEKQTFADQSLRGFDVTQGCADRVYQRCDFVGVSVGNQNDLSSMPRLSRLQFEACSTRGVAFDLAVLDEVEVDQLKTHNMLMFNGTLFRRTILRGRVGKMILNTLLQPENPAFVEECAQHANEFYRNIDWALDISEAIFDDCAIRSVPADLIRRDPETQAVVRRETVNRVGWDHPAIASSRLRADLEDMIFLDLQEAVIIAPKGNRRNFASTMEGIRILRDAGIAEKE